MQRRRDFGRARLALGQTNDVKRIQTYCEEN